MLRFRVKNPYFTRKAFPPRKSTICIFNYVMLYLKYNNSLIKELLLKLDERGYTYEVVDDCLLLFF